MAIDIRELSIVRFSNETVVIKMVTYPVLFPFSDRVVCADNWSSYLILTVLLSNWKTDVFLIDGWNQRYFINRLI